ncbi:MULTISPECIES: BolA family protein [Ponticoccus]|uniref:BolA/IbaG family iron-sulfur metabolism protein n=2 Tax=Ponticoccus TaxID=983507 RepID=A0ABX7FB49_9RHOB|nr:BolA family protein [Ponticoccus alexandrii]ETA50270.2 BolA family transcriptional regulator [Rhodobacteraceae bacterium PD-2]QRF67096.1 BolA/IbaG family iron-sulfur metabolism protein [Ponticoccus alexandrii]
MSRAEEMRRKLEEAFAPTRLDIRNDSERHASHAGYDGTGESHFHVTIRAPGFAGQSRVARHRAMHAALGDLTTRIHALSFDIDA